MPVRLFRTCLLLATRKGSKILLISPENKFGFLDQTMLAVSIHRVQCNNGQLLSVWAVSRVFYYMTMLFNVPSPLFPKEWCNKDHQGVKYFITLYLVQLIEHPILRIPNFLFTYLLFEVFFFLQNWKPNWKNWDLDTLRPLKMAVSTKIHWKMFMYLFG